MHTSHEFSLSNRGLELQPKLQLNVNMQIPCQSYVSTKQTLENIFGQRMPWYDLLWVCVDGHLY